MSETPPTNAANDRAPGAPTYPRLVVEPGRPRVRVGREVYEVVEPETLRELIEELGEQIYAQHHVPLSRRHRMFAKAVAAAAVNVLVGNSDNGQ